MKTNQLVSKIILATCSMVLSFTVANAQKTTNNENKNIQLITPAVELVSVTQSAEKCKDQKGITLKLKVVSETPVDILRYAKLKNSWAPSQWLGQKKGDEIVDYACRADTPFKFVSRPAGSTEQFLKP